MKYLLKFFRGLRGFFPSWQQWGQFFKVLNGKEKKIFLLFFSLVIISGVFLNLNFYFKNTEIAPAVGGIYQEGLVGQPRFINPIYLSTQDVDRDLVEILFSGLMKYNEKGEITEDLVATFEIKEEGKVFEVLLRDNIFWHDGERLTSDDVIFTIDLIQDPQYQSPLRIKWFGVRVEKISAKAIRFRLPEKYAGFLENLTLKILPKHIFEDLAPQNLPWELVSEEYLIGSGPFKFKKIIQDKSGYVRKLTLERNKNFYGKKPYLEEISFLFFQDEKEVISRAQVGEIQGFSMTDPKNFDLSTEKNFESYFLSLPRYFAVFFNLKQRGLFEEKSLREALRLTLNKDEILQDVFLGRGEIVNSPILPEFFGFEAPAKIYQFDTDKAKEILDEQGFKINPETGKREKIVVKETPLPFKRNLVSGSKGEDVRELQECLARDKEVYPEGEITGFFGVKTKAAVIRFQEKYAQDILTPIGLSKGTGDVKAMTRKKLNQICVEEQPEEIIPLKFTLTTSDKFPLVQIAEVLERNWENMGAEVDVKKVSLSELQTDVLAKRNYELLLFGEALSSMPDPFPFWHSSQKEHPGLNITSYVSKEVDKLLEAARQTFDARDRKENLEEFQDILIEDLPAIFLVRGDYLYLLSPKIKGYTVEKITEPAKRFTGIEGWYIKTKRIWK